jgi:hypothetical protein
MTTLSNDQIFKYVRSNLKMRVQGRLIAPVFLCVIAFGLTNTVYAYILLLVAAISFIALNSNIRNHFRLNTFDYRNVIQIDSIDEFIPVPRRLILNPDQKLCAVNYKQLDKYLSPQSVAFLKESMKAEDELSTTDLVNAYFLDLQLYNRLNNKADLENSRKTFLDS